MMQMKNGRFQNRLYNINLETWIYKNSKSTKYTEKENDLQQQKKKPGTTFPPDKKYIYIYNPPLPSNAVEGNER